MCPAEFNNLVGIKPTVGLVARDGMIPVSESQDSPEPMARTVKDAAELLAIIAGESEFDKRTWDIPFPTQDFSACCSSTNLSGIRIDIPRNTFGDIAASVLRKFEKLPTLSNSSVMPGIRADLFGFRGQNSRITA